MSVITALKMAEFCQTVWGYTNVWSSKFEVLLYWDGFIWSDLLFIDSGKSLIEVFCVCNRNVHSQINSGSEVTKLSGQ